MVNGLKLYSALSGPKTPKRFTLQSFNHSHILMVVRHTVATAALGQQHHTPVTQDPVTTTSRRGVWIVLPKDTRTDTNRVEVRTSNLSGNRMNSYFLLLLSLIQQRCEAVLRNHIQLHFRMNNRMINPKNLSSYSKCLSLLKIKNIKIGHCCIFDQLSVHFFVNFYKVMHFSS